MNIRELQTRLVQLGFSLGQIDGVQGPRTRNAIREFQEKNGLVPDSIAGPQTKKALREATTEIKPGRAEPWKAAMALAVPDLSHIAAIESPPPNVGSLKLLDTARAIDEIINHCAATPEGKNFTVADIRAWHKARGFTDTGYHYVIYLDGRIMEGRPIGQTGAHVEGHNSRTIGICYIGGLSADAKTPKDTRTKAQKASLLWLNKKLAQKFSVQKISGHNEYSAKACPSFDVRKDPLGSIV